MPTETPARVGFKLEHRFVEIPIAGVAADVFEIDLRRHHHKHAEYKRYKQPLEALTGKLTRGAFTQGHIRACSGNKKQERHAEVMRPHHPVLESGARFVVLYMPAPFVEPHAGVKKQQNQNGNETSQSRS